MSGVPPENGNKEALLRHILDAVVCVTDNASELMQDRCLFYRPTRMWGGGLAILQIFYKFNNKNFM